MHTGSMVLATLPKITTTGPGPRPGLEPDDRKHPAKSRLLRPLGLNWQDLADLEAFLRALDEPTGRAGPSLGRALDEEEALQPRGIALFPR